LMCPPEMWPIAATATAIPSPCAIEIAINLDESRPESNEPVMTTAPVPMNTKKKLRNDGLS
jgi:hypothetical protein